MSVSLAGGCGQRGGDGGGLGQQLHFRVWGAERASIGPPQLGPIRNREVSIITIASAGAQIAVVPKPLPEFQQ